MSDPKTDETAPIAVSFYHFVLAPGRQYSTIQLLDPEQAGLWEGVINKIKPILIKNIQELHLVGEEEDGSYADRPDRRLYILLTKIEDLADEHFLKKFVCKFRRSPHFNVGFDAQQAIEGKARKPERDHFTYHPVITIGLEDIMTIFSEETFSLQRSNHHLHRLRFDARIKYLDSSIWQRYVSLFPNSAYYNTILNGEPPFDFFLDQVLHRMNHCLKNNIYLTNIARSTLEFQSRMLLNSFIAEVGDQGHHEVVTPFKFHSETQMMRMSEEVLDFFRKPRGANGAHNLLKNVDWKMLLVDDYSNPKMANDTPEAERDIKNYPPVLSTLDPRAAFACKVNKQMVIEQLIEEKYAHWTIDNRKSDNWIRIEPPEADRGKSFIREVEKKLKEGIHDVLLVDYLLGDKDDSGDAREYGHEFLRALTQRQYGGKAYQAKRGPLSKYWIFPISSFPNAFVDKMRQLGITALGEHFYISSGGDPICTPELFCYNLFYFMQQQVEQCLVDDESFANSLNNYRLLPKKDWSDTLTQAIQYFLNRENILQGDSNNNSVLAEKLKDAIGDFENDRFISKIKKVIAPKTKRQKLDFHDTHNTETFLNLIEAFPHFIKSINEIFQRWLELDLFVDSSMHVANRNNSPVDEIDYFEKRIFRLSQLPTNREKITALNLQDNKLLTLPEELLDLPNLKSVNVANNKFKRIPWVIAEGLHQWKSLRSLDLSGNDFSPYIEKKIRKIEFRNREDLNNLKKFLDQEENKYLIEPKESIGVYLCYSRADRQEVERFKLFFNILNYRYPNLRIVEKEDYVKDEQYGQLSIAAPNRSRRKFIEKELGAAKIMVLINSSSFNNFNQEEKSVLLEDWETYREKAFRIDLENTNLEAPFHEIPAINKVAVRESHRQQIPQLPDRIWYEAFIDLKKEITIHHDLLWGRNYLQGFALLIGSDTSGNLRGSPANDIQGFRESLLAAGYLQQHIVSISDSEKEIEERDITQAFEQIAAVMKTAKKRFGDQSNQHFIFFYSGHGAKFEDEEDSFFMPLNKSGDKKLQRAQIEGLIKKVPSTTKMVLLDCCYSGSLTVRNGDSPQMQGLRGIHLEIDDQSTEKAPFIIASSYPNNVSKDHPNQKNGYFTDSLLKAWDDARISDSQDHKNPERFLYSSTLLAKIRKHGEQFIDIQQAVIRNDAHFSIGKC